MNPNQTFHVRISQNMKVTEHIQVESLNQVVDALMESFLTHKTPSSRRVQMVVEISNQALPMGQSLLTREQQMEQDMMSRTLTDLDEVIFEPDITLREVNEALGSPEGELMLQYQRPDRRMGVDPELLKRIKSDYELKFPRVAQHAPKWGND